MTTTMLRHEFIRTIRPTLAILGVAVVVMLLADMLGFFVGIFGLVLGAMVVTLVLPAIQFYLAIDFYRSSYGVGAILTHSLPVTGRRLFWTKSLHAILVSVAIGIVSLLLLFGHLWVVLNMADVALAEATAAVQQVLNQMPGLLPVIIFGLVWVLIMPIAAMFASVVIGSGGWARRLSFGGPVIVFVAYYLIMQLLGVVSFFIPPVYNFLTAEVHMVSMFTYISENPQEPVMPLLAIVIQIVVLAGLVLWASREMNSKVELH